MKIFVEIQRFNPESDTEPYIQKYSVDVEPTDRLLFALLDIKGTQDPTLGIRKSCAHGVCGSDAMVINGKERLACKTLIQDVAKAEAILWAEGRQVKGEQRQTIKEILAKMEEIDTKSIADNINELVLTADKAIDDANVKEIELPTDIKNIVVKWKKKYNLLFGHLDIVREDSTSKLFIVDPGTFPEFSNWNCKNDPVSSVCNLILAYIKKTNDIIKNNK